MKKIKILIILLLTFLIPINIKAEEQVNLYLFHSQDCMHCKAEREFLEQIKDKYKNLKVTTYEVTRNKENVELLEKVKAKLHSTTQYVPFTVIGTKYFIGYNDDTALKIENMIKEQSKNKQRDVVYEVINNIESEDIENTDQDNENTSDATFVVPVLGKIDAKDVSLPLLAVIIGVVDGFNPCAMWVLIFLISMLIGMKNRKRMLILGISFLVSSALVYLLFMVAWLKVALTLTQIRWIQILIALVALIGAFINLKSYYKSLKNKNSGCEVVDDKKRKKIITKIKKFTTEKSFILALIGIITLAVSVNLVELACSAGLPLLFTQILALNNLNPVQYSIYILIYIFFFLIDDLIVFLIAMITFKVTGISTKYTKYTHLIGGIIMLIIGILMIVKPNLLMFNL